MGEHMAKDYLQRLNQVLEQGLAKDIFDNLRNFLMCSLLFAAGTNALHDPRQLFLGLAVSSPAGWGLMVLAAVLTLLNIWDGLHKLARLKRHLLLQVAVCLVYVVLALRVVEIVWGFRSP
ncbi:hypothetical protein [Pseudomonas sp. 2FG]|uniref:hypothetical protein n=1 Tax=Pseudomonas sp. 2FG TaxID=2502191 RepID=UPI002113B607|nr:hypothetical protein [Pseudomonas sp. 2FG]